MFHPTNTNNTEPGKELSGVLLENRPAKENLAVEEIESQLREQTCQLESLNKELDSFAYSISHDLRAPLRSIDGFSQLLLKKAQTKLGEDELRYLNNICENTQQMGEMIDVLLKLSRLSRSETVYEMVDLSVMAESILLEYRQRQPDRQMTFQITPHLLVKGDRNLLKIILENLLGNAWKFTEPTPNACIEFGVIQENEGPTYFVRDNGVGFNMKYADRLFGAFQRMHRIDEFPGIGIGLATVQRAMNRQGGRVWAKSVINEGTTIYFTFQGLLPGKERMR